MAKSDFLDPLWQKKRLEILERDGFRCFACGDSKKTLHVHHVLYCNKPWITPSLFMQTLCEECHAALGKHPKGGTGYIWINDGPPELGLVLLYTAILYCPKCGFADTNEMVKYSECPSCGFGYESTADEIELNEHVGLWYPSPDEFAVSMLNRLGQ